MNRITVGCWVGVTGCRSGIVGTPKKCVWFLQMLDDRARARAQVTSWVQKILICCRMFYLQIYPAPRRLKLGMWEREGGLHAFIRFCLLLVSDRRSMASMQMLWALATSSMWLDALLMGSILDNIPRSVPRESSWDVTCRSYWTASRPLVRTRSGLW